MTYDLFWHSGFLPILAILFPCLSIRFFCYVINIPIFCSKIVLLLSHSIEDISSQILPQLARRKFFHSLVMSFLVWVVWLYFCIFLPFFLSQLTPDLSLQVESFVLIILLCSFRPNIFSSSAFVGASFLVWSVELPIQVLSFWLYSFKNPDFSQSNFAPALICSFNSVILFFEVCVNISFIFSVSTLSVFQSWSLRDGKCGFLFRHLSLYSLYIYFSSCINVFGGVMFWLQLLCFQYW